jgi:2-polyprenyl-6-methoxyphenol hydroxylase-like FAD-dependent oxidoreductase
MEDAIVLAQCLRDIPEVVHAFATYERLRRERVERVVQYARSLGSWRAMTNPIQMWFWELLQNGTSRSLSRHLFLNGCPT